jgi:hypothetical protein
MTNHYKPIEKALDAARAAQDAYEEALGVLEDAIDQAIDDPASPIPTRSFIDLCKVDLKNQSVHDTVDLAKKMVKEEWDSWDWPGKDAKDKEIGALTKRIYELEKEAKSK